MQIAELYFEDKSQKVLQEAIRIFSYLSVTSLPEHIVSRISSDVEWTVDDILSTFGMGLENATMIRIRYFVGYLTGRYEFVEDFIRKIEYQI